MKIKEIVSQHRRDFYAIMNVNTADSPKKALAMMMLIFTRT